MKVVASIAFVLCFGFFLPVSRAGGDPPQTPSVSEPKTKTPSTGGMESNPYFDSRQERSRNRDTVPEKQTRRISSEDDRSSDQPLDQRLGKENVQKGNRGGETSDKKRMGNREVEKETRERRIREDHLNGRKISTVNEPREYKGTTVSDSSSFDDPKRYAGGPTRDRSSPNKSDRDNQHEHVGRITGDRRSDHEPKRDAGRTSSDSSPADDPRRYDGGTARRPITAPKKPHSYVTGSSDEMQSHVGRRRGERISDDYSQRNDKGTARDRRLNEEPHREDNRANRARNREPQRSDGKPAGVRTPTDDLRRANDEDSSSSNMERERVTTHPNTRPTLHDRSNTYSRSTSARPNTRFGRFNAFMERWGEKFERLDDKLTDYKDRAFDRLGDNLHNAKQSMKYRLDIKDDSSSVSDEYNKDGYRKSDIDPEHGGLAYV